MAKKKKTKKKTISKKTKTVVNKICNHPSLKTLGAKAQNMIRAAVMKIAASNPKALSKYEATPEKLLIEAKISGQLSPADQGYQTTQVYIEEEAKHAEYIQFPVNPQSFEVESGQNNQTLNVNAAGEINLPGKRALKSVELQSFFPAQDYSFLQCKRKSDPYAYIRWLDKRKNEGTVVRAIITGTGVNLPFLIDDLRYGEDDASGDVNFTISLKEYRTLKATRANKISTSTGQSSGKSTTNKNIYITKKGDTIKSIAKKKLGSASKGKKLYKKNKKAIEKAFKKWLKAENKRRKKAGKKELKWKNSKKGKHLAPGTRIVLK